MQKNKKIDLSQIIEHFEKSTVECGQRGWFEIKHRYCKIDDISKDVILNHQSF